MMTLAVVALAAAAHQLAAAEPCAADNRTRVAADDECLVIGTYGEPAERTSLIIFIHGDGYRGGPSDYMYPLAQVFGVKGVVAVGLIRPGYYNSKDDHNYRPDVIATVAAAVTARRSVDGQKQTLGASRCHITVAWTATR